MAKGQMRSNKEKKKPKTRQEHKERRRRRSLAIRQHAQPEPAQRQSVRQEALAGAAQGVVRCPTLPLCSRQLTFTAGAKRAAGELCRRNRNQAIGVELSHITSNRQEYRDGRKTEDARRSVRRHAERHLLRRKQNPQSPAQDGEGRRNPRNSRTLLKSTSSRPKAK